MNENNTNENLNEEPVEVTPEEQKEVKIPKKRFTALQTVLISAICVVLTFMLTALTVINAMNAYFDGIFKLMNDRLEDYEKESENMVLGNVVTDEQRQRLFSLLLELDSAFQNYEFNEMDYKAITDYVLEAYAAAVGDKYAEYYTKEEYEATQETSTIS